MKKTILFIGFLILLIIPKPNYFECDHIKIIEEINIHCDNDKIITNFHEIVPKRENNSVLFHYNDFSYTTNNLYELKQEIYKNHIYVMSVNEVNTNCDNLIEIAHILNISKYKIKRK